jgi:HAD superfamily hydrolase (TIGR01509 family)
MTLRALVFDFDGLILDTEWPEYLAVSEAYERHGHRLEIAEWQARVGTVGENWIDELEARVGRPVDRASVGTAWDERRSGLLSAADPLPGIADLIEAAHAAGLGLAVASSARTPWLDHHLDRLGLHARFDALIGRDKVGDRAKPSPDVYLAALEALGVGAHQAVALEDSPHGVAAARGAGLACIAIPNRVTLGGDFAAASLIVESATAVSLDTLRGLVP